MSRTPRRPADPARAAAEALARRAERLAECRDDPRSHFGELPAGFEAAFHAGARLPWPGPRAARHLVERWVALRRTGASGTMRAEQQAEHRGRSDVAGSSNSGTDLAGSVWQGSSNWSGAFTTARGGLRFSSVTARWRVPDARVNHVAPPGVTGSEDSPPSRRCSVWIGLDGHRAVARSMPQIGTTTKEVFLDRGRREVRCYAWAQWWVRGENYGEVKFEGFTVSPGDEVVCWLALLDPRRVVMCIRNETTGAEDSVLWRSGPKDGGARRDGAEQAHDDPAPVQGMGAVWVVERPTVMYQELLYPLPDFGEVEFRDCIAGLRRADQPFHEVAELRALEGRRLIRMFDQRAEPWRAPRISLPENPVGDRTRLLVRYREEQPPAIPKAAGSPPSAVAA
ncbi:hypothetical protein DFH01_21750 [Falsiroseomonas bella]|uniref:Uncharacterized protein n=1 Tax=Falsiroseomonas bella TaxID=2184016 RepID=A0A317F7C9_9PROT|nr:G1 family glutamic endopeptidase [Falsiroseomonas bella]PWS34964.1 hypothetical protein DFH01_21750 [Falsiroseomonas bella]